MTTRDQVFRLTRREREMVGAILAGHTTHQRLAEALTLAPATVRGHLSSIYGKVGAHNMADLVLMATGLLPALVEIRSIKWK